MCGRIVSNWAHLRSVELAFVGNTKCVLFRSSIWTRDCSEWSMLILFGNRSSFILAESWRSKSFVFLSVPRSLLQILLIFFFKRHLIITSTMLVNLGIWPSNFDHVRFDGWVQLPGVDHHKFEVLIVVNWHRNIVVVFNKFFVCNLAISGRFITVFITEMLLEGA